MAEISIIMPVATQKEYFSEAIESLRNQTCRDYELILVDDCCKDAGVQEILSRLQSEGHTVIHNQTKQGAAKSRNLGFTYATGEYVLFLDSDDVFAPRLLEALHDKITAEAAEVCICDHRWFREKNGTREYFENHQVPEHPETAKLIDLVNISPAPWKRMARRDFLTRNHIVFQDLTCCNDVYFAMMGILLAKKIAYVNELLVDYRQDASGSISRKRDCRCIYYAVRQVWQDMKNSTAVPTRELEEFLGERLLSSYHYEIYGMASSSVYHNLSLYLHTKHFLRRHHITGLSDETRKIRRAIFVPFGTLRFIRAQLIRKRK